jgi:hypothetical protein
VGLRVRYPRQSAVVGSDAPVNLGGERPAHKILRLLLRQTSNAIDWLNDIPPAPTRRSRFALLLAAG